ncbi:MAG: hypothetical protein AAF533_19040 [Acidobacteriota bacterium]
MLVSRRHHALILAGLVVLLLTTTAEARRKKQRSQFPKKAWKQLTFHELSVESPVALHPVEGIVAELSETVRQRLVSHESHMSRDERLLVGVTRAVYVPGTALNLEGAVRGAITNAAAAVGTSPPDYVTEPVVVDGLAGLRVSCRILSEPPMSNQLVVIHHGTTQWMLHVAHSDAKMASDAERIVSSLTIDASSLAPDWPRRRFDALSFESPVALDKELDLHDQLPEAVHATFESLTARYGERSDGFAVLAQQATLVEGAPFDIDASVEGAVAGMAGLIGDTTPKHRSEEITLGGASGRRFQYLSSDGSPTFLLEGLSLHEGRRTWQVTVMMRSKEQLADAERVLASVQLVRER